jgi:hypothetical protein
MSSGNNQQNNSIRLNSPVYVLISGILLIFLAIFTKQGNKTFNSLTSMFGELSKEILLVVVVLLIVIMIINIYDLDMDIYNYKTNGNARGKVIEKRVVEGLSGVSNVPSLNTDDKYGTQSFCEKYQSDPVEMDKRCQKLNKNSCIIPSCCIWLNDKKCVSGGISGPTFTTDDNDNDIEVNNFTFQGKCYGDGCE